ncbi:hypothetical protein EHQ79_18790 [Leptospira jelokensis]|nr:hypothetical protein EHQ79_18790 [Leptospira jelokensis]
MRSQATCQSLTSRSGTQGRGTSVSLFVIRHVCKTNLRLKIKIDKYERISYFISYESNGDSP